MNELRTILRLHRDDPVQLESLVNELLQSGECRLDDIHELATALERPGLTSKNLHHDGISELATAVERPDRTTKNFHENGINGLATAVKRPGRTKKNVHENGINGLATAVEQPGQKTKKPCLQKSKMLVKTSFTTIWPSEEVSSILCSWVSDPDSITQPIQIALRVSQKATFREIYSAARSISTAEFCARVIFRFCCVSLFEACKLSYYHDGTKFVTGAPAALDAYIKTNSPGHSLEGYVQKGIQYRRLADMLGGLGALVVLPQTVPDSTYTRLNSTELNGFVQHLLKLEIAEVIEKYQANEIAKVCHDRYRTTLPLFSTPETGKSARQSSRKKTRKKPSVNNTTGSVTRDNDEPRQKPTPGATERQISLENVTYIPSNVLRPDGDAEIREFSTDSLLMGLGDEMPGTWYASETPNTVHANVPQDVWDGAAGDQLMGQGDEIPMTWTDLYDGQLMGQGDEIPTAWSELYGRLMGHGDEIPLAWAVPAPTQPTGQVDPMDSGGGSANFRRQSCPAEEENRTNCGASDVAATNRMGAMQATWCPATIMVT